MRAGGRSSSLSRSQLSPLACSRSRQRAVDRRAVAPGRSASCLAGACSGGTSRGARPDGESGRGGRFARGRSPDARSLRVLVAAMPLTTSRSLAVERLRISTAALIVPRRSGSATIAKPTRIMPLRSGGGGVSLWDCPRGDSPTGTVPNAGSWRSFIFELSREPVGERAQPAIHVAGSVRDATATYAAPCRAALFGQPAVARHWEPPPGQTDVPGRSAQGYNARVTPSHRDLSHCSP